jgi:phosphohistidine phosphatase
MTAPRASLRQLTLVRHAHAQPHDRELEDFERRLDKRGRHEARDIAARARDLGLRPDHLISSPADRAIETARELAKALEFPLHRIRSDDRVYLAEREQLVAILRAAPPTTRHVLLVGHNPGLSRLAAWVTDDESLGELPTAALVSARGELDRWHDLYAGSLERVCYETP